METLNSAIVGCGAIYANHADAVINSKKAKLAAVCDIDKKKLAAAADKYKCKGYDDYTELLKDDNIQVIHICTPHYLHAPMAIEAMRKGKHVLTEKPMAISVEEAEKMINVSNETGMKLGVCFQNRYNTTSMKIYELLKTGNAGKIKGAKGWMTWYRDEEYYKGSNWRGTWEKEGGGVLINQSIHTLDLLNWFIGDIASLRANVDTRMLEGIIEVEDTADALLKTKDGTSALFYATNCYCINSPVEIEIICEKAVIRLSDSLIIKYNDGRKEEILNINKASGEKAYWGLSHSLLIEDFYDSILENREFLVNGYEGIKTIKIIKAIYESSKSKRFVETGL